MATTKFGHRMCIWWMTQNDRDTRFVMHNEVAFSLHASTGQNLCFYKEIDYKYHQYITTNIFINSSYIDNKNLEVKKPYIP